MQIVTIKEVAALLQVRPKTIYQWAELKQIPCLKLNGSLRFDLDDIETWIAGCRLQPKNSYNPLTKLEAQRKGGRNN